MDWTPEQEEIFRFFRAERGNLMVNAVAGSGKSTTIREGVIWAPEPSVLICAFNRHIADEMNQSLGKIKGRMIKAATLHSVGYEIIRHYWPKVPLKEYRNEELARQIFDRAKVKKKFKFIKAICDTCDKIKDALPLAETVDDVVMVGEDFDTLLPDKELPWDIQGRLVLATLEAAKLNTGSIGYSDMVWLPVVNNWTPPGKFRLVIIDEIQDVSTAQLLLARKMVAQPFGRMAFFGDSNQSVYSWRGADRFSIERTKQDVKCTELPLNVSFRCSKEVVKEAKKLVPSITSLEDAPVGKVRTIEFAEIGLLAQPGDFVLSRFNAPLIPACIAIRRMGSLKNLCAKCNAVWPCPNHALKAHIDGKDALAQAKNVIQKIARTGKGGIATFEQDVNTWMQKEIAIARGRGSPSRSQRAIDFGLLLGRLGRECSSMSEVEEILDALFKGRRSPNAIVCSTIHRAKGREANQVFILRDTLPLRMADGEGAYEIPTKDFDFHEERNLEYIAISRAKNTLYWVNGLPEARSAPQIDDDWAPADKIPDDGEDTRVNMELNKLRNSLFGFGSKK